MSDAIPLPPRPNLDQHKELAKDFQQACKSGGAAAIRQLAASWAETVARLQGREITPQFRSQIDWHAAGLEQRWRRLQESNEAAARCTLASARFFIAREHGFASWPRFARHLQSLVRVNSPVSQFEAAADAIVSGDLARLEKLLRKNPELARARSTRSHRSTLLHYVSANGIEDFRQRTPKNIVEITKLLLKGGANVNAESDAYGGRSTTLGLAATSCHPEEAGVQLPLMELLIANGALVDGPDGGSAVNGCLHNGRGEAAEFLASRGARLDLEGAAGVGRLDLVKGYFNAKGRLKRSATRKQMTDGFAWACEFGRTNVVDFLLHRGMKLDAKLRHDGQTGLHWAAWGGHADTVKLLLQRGARIDARDQSYNGTPLGWALYCWGNSPERPERDYYGVISLLVTAGAKLDPEWYEDDEDRLRALDKIRSDPRMVAALGSEMSR